MELLTFPTRPSCFVSDGSIPNPTPTSPPGMACSRFIFSGDIHAIGASSIIKSGEESLERAVKTFLVGPVSSSTGTWPSFARGITAENPKYLNCETIYSIKEENGFTFFQIDNDKALAEIISCGGHNPENGDTGKILSQEIVSI